MLKRKIIIAKKRTAIAGRIKAKRFERIFSNEIKAGTQIARIKEAFKESPNDYKKALRVLIDNSTDRKKAIYLDEFQRIVNPAKERKIPEVVGIFRLHEMIVKEKNPAKKIGLHYQILDFVEDKALKGDKTAQKLFKANTRDLWIIIRESKEERMKWYERMGDHLTRMGDLKSALLTYRKAAQIAEKDIAIRKLAKKIKEIEKDYS